MVALMIVMLWLGMAVALNKYENKKKEEEARREKRRRYEMAKRYDFDILSYDEQEYFELKKSA